LLLPLEPANSVGTRNRQPTLDVGTPNRFRSGWQQSLHASNGGLDIQVSRPRKSGRPVSRPRQGLTADRIKSKAFRDCLAAAVGTPPRTIAIVGLAKSCDSNRRRVKKNRPFFDFWPPALPFRRGGAGCPPQDTKWNRRRFLPRKSGSVSIRGSAGWLDEKFSFGTEKSPAAVADPSSTKREMLVGEPAQRRPGCSRIPAPGFEQRCVGRYLDLASSNHRRGRYFEHKRSQAGGQSP
jgi:hypothetical protein